MNRYQLTEKYILEKLKRELPSNLHYHSYDHVKDVLSAAQLLGEHEKISEKDMEILKIAVLFHDCGYIVTSKDHEKISCEIAKDILPQFEFSSEEIEKICELIMATHYPQHPKNLLEQIICDADLDYLGRDDFFTIANNLFKELEVNGQIRSNDEWYILQEKFLLSHHYFTQSAIKLRNAKKIEHLEKIRSILSTKVKSA